MKYIPNPAKYNFADIIDPIFWESSENEAIQSFIDYSAEYGDAPYAVIDEKNVSIIWQENSEKPEQKHVCIIAPSKRTATFQSFDGSLSNFELSENLLSTIERATKNWELSVTPFKHQKEKNKKHLNISTITINGNPDAKQVAMPESLFASFTDKDNRGFSLNANYMKRNGIKGTIFYEKKFLTAQESIVDLIKVAIGIRNTGYEVEFYDGENNDIKYSLEDMEQLVFQYSQAQSPSDTNVLELPTFNPTDEKEIRTYLEAVKKGELALVKQFLLAGAEPFSYYLKTASKSRKIDVFNTALDAKQKEVAIALLKHYKAIGNTVYDWMDEAIKSL